MTRRVRIAGALAATSLLAGLLPSLAAPTAHAVDISVDITKLTYAGPVGEECVRRGPKIVCTPTTVAPRLANGSIASAGQLNLQFNAVVDPAAYEDQMSSTLEYPLAAVFSVRGFVSTPGDCTYRFSPSHLTTGRPYPLPNGLVVYTEDVSAGLIGRVDGNLLYPKTYNASVNARSQGGTYFCAITGAAIQEVADGVTSFLQTPRLLDNVQSVPLILEIQAPPTPRAITARTPEINAQSVGVPFTYRSNYSIVATVAGDVNNGRIASRLLFIGTAEADGAACTGTIDSPRYYLNITSSGTRTYVYDSNVFMRNDVGRWLCTYQQVLNANGEESTSVPSYKKIEQPVGAVPEIAVPVVNVPGLLSRLSSSAAALRQALGQPQVNQAEVDRLVAEAEAARQAAEEAIRNGSVNNGGGVNAGGNGGGANPGVPEVVEEIDRVDELIDRGKGTATPRSALEVATGFDATVTPLLPIGSRTASGLELSVKSPTKVKRARPLTVTAKVDPGKVRGRLRMFLLRFDGETPVVVQKRSGFIGAAQRSKKFYINRGDRLGTYAILTSFDPTTPGQVGVATLTPLTVVK